MPENSYTIYLLLFYCSLLLVKQYRCSAIDNINSISIAPTITALISINTSTLAPIVQFEAYGNYMYRLGNDNKIHVWDKLDMSFPNPKFVTNPVNTIVNFAIQETAGDFSYLDNLGNVVIIKIVDGSTETSFNVGFSSALSRIQMSWFSIFVSQPGNSSVFPKLYRFSRTNQTLLGVFDMYQLTNDIRIAKCIKPVTPVYQFIMGWDSTSFFQMYTFGDGWNNVYGNRNFTKNISWAVTDVEWGDWCQYYTATYELLKQSTVYDGANGYIVHSYTFTQNVYSSILFDVRKLILAAFLQDKTAQFIDTSQPGASVFLTQIYTNLSYFNKFSQNSSTFFVAIDTNIIIYLIGCSNSYSLAMGICSLCDDNANCYQAPSNSTSNTSQIINSSNSSYSENFTNSSNFANSSNFTNVSTANSTINQNFTLNVTNQIQLQVQNNNLLQQVSFLRDYVEKTMTIIGYTILIMQCTPLVNYFLRFINFWSICSMYVILNINLYPYFYQIMVRFYKISNISIFQLLNFNLPWLKIGQNKIQGKYDQQFSLTTNFMDNLQQPLIMGFSCAISIYVFNKLVKLICSPHTYRKLKLNFYMGIQSSFVSQMSGFVLSLSILFTNFYQSSVYEKINLIMYTLFVILCVMCPFAILLLNGQKVKKNAVILPKSTHFLRPNNLQYKSIISHPYFDLFYVSLINIFIPGLVTLQQPLWFITIGGGLHLLRIWVDILRSSFTINGVLLSVQILLFHTSFSLLYFDFQLQINQFIILFTLGILILGGLHQIFTVFFGVFYQIYRFFKYNNVQDEKFNQQSQNVQKTKQKKDQNKKQKNRPKLKFATTNTYIQTNPNPIKKKTLKIQKTFCNLKKKTNFLNIQPSQPYIESQIETFDFSKRVKTIIKLPKFSVKNFQ